MAVKTIGNAAPLEKTIKEAAWDKVFSNPDGFCIGKTRTLDKTEAKNALINAPLDGLMLHWRFATAGNKSVENVHGWEMNGWRFIHNGHAAHYYSEGTAVKPYDGKNYGYPNTHWGREKWWKEEERKEIKSDSDSLRFFRRYVSLVKPNDTPKRIASIIEQLCDEKYFQGRAILYHEAKDRAYFIGDFQTYTLNDSAIMFTSATTDFKGEKGNVHGLPFTNSPKVKRIEIDGIGYINGWSKPNWRYIKVKDSKRLSAYGNY